MLPCSHRLMLVVVSSSFRKFRVSQGREPPAWQRREGEGFTKGSIGGDAGAMPIPLSDCCGVLNSWIEVRRFFEETPEFEFVKLSDLKHRDQSSPYLP